ncbi:MAG: DUF58 domain-containing protein [Pseudomonadota bacterium]
MSSPARVEVEDLLALRDGARALSLKSVARRTVQSGARRSAFRARGMDYDESRRYQVGDDMRNLDWRVMARTGEPYTKLFREERERPVLFCVDLGPSMFFATRGVFKSVMASRCAALLAWTALAHGDRVGGIVFGSSDHSERRPARGKTGVLRLLCEIAMPAHWEVDRERRDGAFERAVERLVHVARPGSLVVILSDFVGMSDASSALLARVAAHSDLLNVLISDPVERAMPEPGRYPIADGGSRYILDSRSRDNRRAHRERFEDRRERVDELSAKSRARSVYVSTDDNPLDALGNTLAAVGRS